MWTLIPNDVEAFILQVEKDRRPKQNLQDKKWNMAVDEEYMNELLKYDFTSTKKRKRLLITFGSEEKEPAIS